MRLFLLLLAISIGAIAQTEPRQEVVLTFKGRPVVIFHPKQLDELFPAGPVKICLQQEPLPKCYTAPEDFGRYAKVESVSLDGESEAMLLSVASGGVSGFRIHLALLQPDESENLKNLLLSASTLSDQSQFRFLVEPEISPAKILVTATFDWGLNDAHHGAHRYFISTYVRQFYYDNQEWVYALADQYMTVKVYERESNENIIQAELKEIRSRLRRVAPKLARPQKK
jgi:hypothetical protein